MSRKGQVYRLRVSRFKPLTEAAKGYIAAIIDGFGFTWVQGTKVKSLSEAQKGYIAGILDGEGHLYIRGEYEGVCYSRVRVRITDEEVVTYLKKTTGVGTISSHLPNQKRRDGGSKRRIYEWNVGQRAHVQELLRAILPFLIVKANRARWVLEFESLKSQGISSGDDVRKLIDLIASEQTHKPNRAGRSGLRRYQ